MFFGVKLSVKVSWLAHHRAHLHLHVNMEKVHNFTETRRATTARQILFWKPDIHLCLATIVITNPTKNTDCKKQPWGQVLFGDKKPALSEVFKTTTEISKKDNFEMIKFSRVDLHNIIDAWNN